MISIVTGTLNRKHLLPYLLENTIFSSNLVELVIIDGGSTDGTIEYLSNITNKNLKFFAYGKRSPYPHYMNMGIRNASYEWICQWNDDVLLNGNWEDVYSSLNNEYLAYKFKWGRISLEKYIQKDINITDWICLDDTINFGVYHKSIFKTIGLYNSDYKYYGCDTDMTQRCIKFDIKIKNSDITVLEINNIEKKALNDNQDRIIYERNIHQYNLKILPNTVEKL